MHNPSLSHWHSLKRCIRYLKYTQSFGLRFQRDGRTRRGGGGGGGGGGLDSRKSTIGGVFVLAGVAVAWPSKMQSSVALSSVEAEYVALALTAKEGL
ncbi:hypothetical protein KP509_37G065200 [Ceratopteris richardii]|uniref:Uncharacterized protein n=1 Tax=Ceratopteris richardii TaxID=49495 RepID=A0A8T2Q9T2_CERRI|nr:hypothetical protein KP509_37G065200 [Ceratopteris richardii]